MALLDDWTKEKIDFEAWRGQLRLMSVYGQARHALRRPFCLGEEEQWLLDRADVLEVLRAYRRTGQDGVSFRQVLGSAFAQLPEIAPVLALLQRGEILSVEHAAQIKRFAYYAVVVQQAMETVDIVLPWWDIASAAKVLRLLEPLAREDEDYSAGFALMDLDDAAWKAAYAILQSVRARRREKERESARELSEAYGSSLRRDRTLIISAMESERIAVAIRDTRLRLRVSTPYESVFEPVWPTAAARGQAEEEVALERLEGEALRVLCGLSAQLRAHAEALFRCTEQLGRLDELWARVALAESQGLAWSTLAAELRLSGGRQPQISDFTPIDLTIADAVTILTGPNMGGKTVALKTLLLLVACHHYGYPIPASSLAAPLFRALRYVGGDAQSMAAGLSSFGSEVEQLIAALRESAALLCLDEIGRGANPAEGAALVAAIAATLLPRTDAAALIATHFPIQVVGCVYLRVKGLREGMLAFAEGAKGMTFTQRLDCLQAAMDYRIIPVEAGSVPLESLRIAEWLGLPPSVIRFAREQLHGTAK